jgi:hypothetical protein
VLEHGTWVVAKSWKKKKVMKTTPKKRHEQYLLCWPTGAKKKSEISKRKFPRLFSGVPSFPLQTNFRKNITRFKAWRTPFRLMLFIHWVYF